MDIQTQIDNLTRKVDYLTDMVERLRFYTEADVNGVRKSSSDNHTDIEDLSSKHNVNAANIDYMAMEMDIDLEV